MKREFPRDARFPYCRRGELSYQRVRFPCLIQDISARGFFIICARDLVIGQELEVRFELTPGCFHQSKIRVQHIDNGCFGAEITDAGKQDGQALQQFVAECFRESKRHQPANFNAILPTPQRTKG
jgi:PilZ domain